MPNASCLILSREDLLQRFKKENINEIKYDYFKSDMRHYFLKDDVILFIDINGDTKILKSRYGKRGIVK